MTTRSGATASAFLTAPFRPKDARLQARLGACRARALLRTIEDHREGGGAHRVSRGRFEVEWSDGARVEVFENVAPFGVLVHVRPASPHAYATLALFARAYGEPSAWLMDEALAREPYAEAGAQRDVAAAWVTKDPRLVLHLLLEGALHAYRWVPTDVGVILDRARPVLDQ